MQNGFLPSMTSSGQARRLGAECYTDALNKVAKTAMQYALIGGECLLKVVDDHFVPIRRDCYLPLGRDDRGNLTSVGMMQTLYENGKKYVLLERRTDIDDNTLIENRLFEVNGQALDAAFRWTR